MYFKETRKSFIAIGNIYFYTATIHNWNRLLHEDAVKRIVTDSLYFLWEKENQSICFCYHAQSYTSHLAAT